MTKIDDLDLAMTSLVEKNETCEPSPMTAIAWSDAIGRVAFNAV
jgi:hypothetical protein